LLMATQRSSNAPKFRASASRVIAGGAKGTIGTTI
jgi:hypothetical protein